MATDNNSEEFPNKMPKNDSACSKKQIISDKLKRVNDQIKQWKEKRRLATLLGKKSRGRRINRNIKKLEILSKNLHEGNFENYNDLLVRLFKLFN